MSSANLSKKTCLEHVFVDSVVAFQYAVRISVRHFEGAKVLRIVVTNTTQCDFCQSAFDQSATASHTPLSFERNAYQHQRKELREEKLFSPPQPCGPLLFHFSPPSLSPCTLTEHSLHKLRHRAEELLERQKSTAAQKRQQGALASSQTKSGQSPVRVVLVLSRWAVCVWNMFDR